MPSSQSIQMLARNTVGYLYWFDRQSATSKF